MGLAKRRYFRHIAAYLALSFLIIGAVPTKGLSYMVTDHGVVRRMRTEDMARVQRVIESRAVSSRLAALGISAPEVEARLAALSDAEVHSFASHLDGLMPGGDALGAIVAVLMIVVLVLLVLKLTDKKIVIK
jgi:hypothetical protein